jgi:hypothetical protein
LAASRFRTHGAFLFPARKQTAREEAGSFEDNFWYESIISESNTYPEKGDKLFCEANKGSYELFSS